MTEVAGRIETERRGNDSYSTMVDWTVPADPSDDEAFIRDATKRFGEELRRTVQAHHNGA